MRGLRAHSFKSIHQLSTGLLAAASAIMVSAGVASAATITVTTGLDEFNLTPNATCSLREAIESANINSDFGGCQGSGAYGSDTIVFSPTITSTQLTITTGMSNDDNRFLDLDIRDTSSPGDLTIDGGPAGVIVQPGIPSWNDRIFDIVSGQSGAVTLRNLTIQGGNGPSPSTETNPLGICISSGGGVRNWSGRPLTLENVIIQNNTMSQNGSGVCQQGGGALTVLSSTIRSNVAINGNGGGILYTGNGALFIDSSTVQSNTARAAGGGIYETSSISMTIQNSDVLSNTVNTPTGGAGGGIWSSGGAATKQIVSSTVAYNRASGNGGGIFSGGTAGRLEVLNSIVLSNTAGAFPTSAGNGGGIWSERALTIVDSRVLSNTALFTGTTTPGTPPGGGGIYHQVSSSIVPPLRITDSLIAHNLARALTGTLVAGGGLWNSGNATLSNTIVEFNRANGALPNGSAYGGGIHNNNNRLELINDSQVRHNQAEWSDAFGGGVSNRNFNISFSIQFVLSTSVVSNNTAQGSDSAIGGGVYNDNNGSATLLASEVRNNLAAGGPTARGGGVASGSALVVNGSLVISNTAAGSATSEGGGVQTTVSAATLITGTQVYSNTARNGGGWHNSANNAQLINSDVRFNQTSAENGGGVHNTGSNLLVKHSVIAQNQAQQRGGGVYNAASGSLQIDTSQVLSNSASDNGGGVYNAGSFATIFSSTLGGNQADAGSGGGIYNASGIVSVTQSSLQSNRAIFGGGAYNAASMTVQASAVQSNTATSFGGGLHNGSTAANLSIVTSTVSGNSAVRGGGLYNESAASVSASALVSNTANASGGGAHNAAGGALSSQNNTFSGNSAPSGGGLNVTAGSSAYLTFTTVASNTAGGGINVSGGTAQVYAALLVYNAGSNCAGVITHNGFSMSSDGSCSGFAFTNTNPLLQPLALNGGQTLNHALPPGSPALDKVPTAQCNVPNDQRGISRPQGGACDIGAFELEEADLAVSKSITPTTAIAGQIITYTVTITNLSALGTASKVVLTDTLAGGVTFGGVVSSGGFIVQSSSPTQVVFTLPSLSAGISTTLTFTATPPTQTTTITNTVVVVSDTPDPNLSNNTASVSNQALAAVYLSVSKAQNYVPYAPGVVLPGATVTYTIVVTNNGPSAASGILVQDTLASGVSYVSAGGANWFCNYTAPTVNCSYIASLPVGNAVSVTIVVTAPSTSNTTFTNIARASGFAYPNTPFNSNVVTLTTAANANLRVGKTAALSSVLAGQPVTYVVTVQNLGPEPATNVVITDVFQGGATFGGVIATSGGATYQINTSTAVTFTVSALDVNDVATAIYTVIAPASGIITNTARAKSDAVDPAPANNTASTNTLVLPTVYLSVSKTQDFVPYAPGVVLPGATVTYTIVVTNNGPSSATSVTVTDNLPAGVTFVSASGTGWSCSFSAPTVSCGYNTPLPAGSSASVMITVTAPITSSTVFTNAASGIAPTTFPGTPFTSNVVTLTTAAQADLDVSKTAVPSPVFGGQLVTYVVTVTTTGPDTATNVVITDVFQGGATFGSVVATSGGATLQSSTTSAVTFTVPSLSVGSTAVMTYTVIAPADGVITNTATVKSDPVDPAPLNNITSTTVTVTPVANLSISKAPSFPTAIAGTITPSAQLTYTILVTNNGPSPAANVVVTDVLPAGLTFVSATGSGWSCGNSGQTVTCTVSSLNVGAAPAIQIVASAPVTPGLVLNNTAVVSSDTYPGTPVNSNVVSVKVQFRAFLPIARRP